MTHHSDPRDITYLLGNPNLLLKISEMQFSVRVKNCLANADIVFLAELLTKSDAELMKIEHFGAKPLNQINEVLADMNLVRSKAKAQAFDRNTLLDARTQLELDGPKKIVKAPLASLDAVRDAGFAESGRALLEAAGFTKKSIEAIRKEQPQAVANLGRLIK